MYEDLYNTNSLKKKKSFTKHKVLPTQHSQKPPIDSFVMIEEQDDDS